jgi:hypothetical protein
MKGIPGPCLSIWGTEVDKRKNRIIDSPIASRAPKQVGDSGLLLTKFYVIDIFISTRLVDRWP